MGRRDKKIKIRSESRMLMDVSGDLRPRGPIYPSAAQLWGFIQARNRPRSRLGPNAFN